jgi:hypothetical protein
MSRTGGPFREASPADLRAALLPEHLDDFDRGYRDALRVAGEDLSLVRLADFLESWRRVAWLVGDMGAEAYRRMMALADRIDRTGDHPGAAVLDEQALAELFRGRRAS